MCALARYAKNCGFNVSGSDAERNERTEQLRLEGVEIYLGHDEKNVKDVDWLVYSSAIPKSNPEIRKALATGIKVFTRAEFLALITSGFKISVAISGSHGKTTTTAMIADGLIADGKEPTVFLGGESEKYGNLLIGSKDYAVYEACEYKGSFLSCHPKIALCTNIDDDHLDYYKTMDAEEEAFKKFLSPTLAVINADDQRLKNMNLSTSVGFGIHNGAYRAKRVKEHDDKTTSFTVVKNGIKKCRINLSVIGRHNLYNALGAYAVLDLLGVKQKNIKRALESFTGIKRRMEYVGTLGDMCCYADYAHHPTEIRSTLNAYLKGENSVVVFQPHTYSRTKLLMSEFVETFKGISDLIIYATYPARETFDASACAYRLYSEIKKKNSCVEYASTPRELFTMVMQNYPLCKRVIFLGAGDVYELVKSKTQANSQKTPKKP